MVITYTPVYVKGPETPQDVSPNFRIEVSNSSALVSMNTDNFSVHHKDGRSSIQLSRYLSAEDCREMAKALEVAALEIERNRQFSYNVGATFGMTLTGDKK